MLLQLSYKFSKIYWFQSGQVITKMSCNILSKKKNSLEHSLQDCTHTKKKTICRIAVYRNLWSHGMQMNCCRLADEPHEAELNWMEIVYTDPWEFLVICDSQT